MKQGKKVAEAARACVGARFRTQGRDPATGMDCVGLAGFAFAAAGVKVRLPADYALRGEAGARIALMLAAHGFVAIETDAIAPGDLMLIAVAPHQSHLAIRTADGFVHADARIRRVVEVPGWPKWPVVGGWRVGDG